jgi:two-component system KDP operon response regulator KdpE
MKPEGGAKILVIDDELEIRRMLKVALGPHGFSIIEAETGGEGLEKAAFARPELIILDMGLPDMDGLQVVEGLREWSNTPIIILSVREQESEKVAALDAGANDYVTKPFSMAELMARIRAALRALVPGQNVPIIRIIDLEMDLAKRLTTVRGQEVKLTPTEYELLKFLVVNNGKVITHKQLLDHIWGSEWRPDPQYLRVYIGQLRKKIESNPSNPEYIITEPGVGYRFTTSDDID